ncbi:hypothetical protein DPMN_135275 [Dreissena polymorpha]|uniref:Uncharacterized protein n=1 Tax=Dreissena polymorpha TaxID=45954 RepID=A0A9D4JCP5_DREPO|nr:hypothetical protein DPMN_135275 [Dreissena polymorpha]
MWQAYLQSSLHNRAVLSGATWSLYCHAIFHDPFSRQDSSYPDCADVQAGLQLRLTHLAYDPFSHDAGQIYLIVDRKACFAVKYPEHNFRSRFEVRIMDEFMEPYSEVTKDITVR